MRIPADHSSPTISPIEPPSDILFLSKRPVTPLRLRVSMGGDDHLLTDGSSARLPLEYATKIPKLVDSSSAVFELLAPAPSESDRFYICAKNGEGGDFIYQGSEKGKIFATHNKLLPLWASLVLIVILLMLASLFSGLNLGLMALDKTELQIIANTGTEKERKYARAIMPVRAHGNYLLCTILLSNVAVNSTFTVILDDLTSGLVAVIGSTLAIVFIAEITPQAICARHGLLIGAKSIWIMKVIDHSIPCYRTNFIFVSDAYRSAAVWCTLLRSSRFDAVAMPATDGLITFLKAPSEWFDLTRIKKAHWQYSIGNSNRCVGFRQTRQVTELFMQC
ncbi:Metal transporter CNNM2 [Eumeta japonica]|uniref:Metal transporter CNNM2 n=1 Tax=Eumeta variegata TaxID=151549 RepID=A0A4C1V1M3_EUMVA|nr:Metal transporter CNNM2 [Eumeta japonica]